MGIKVNVETKRGQLTFCTATISLQEKLAENSRRLHLGNKKTVWKKVPRRSLKPAPILLSRLLFPYTYIHVIILHPIVGLFRSEVLTKMVNK